jgi:hypothetical protein
MSKSRVAICTNFGHLTDVNDYILRCVGQQSDNPPFALTSQEHIMNFGNQMQMIVPDADKMIMKTFEDLRLLGWLT